LVQQQSSQLPPHPILYYHINGIKTNSIINGANLNTYTTPATQFTDSGAKFFCFVANPCNFAKSSAAILSVLSAVSIISPNPQNNKSLFAQ